MAGSQKSVSGKSRELFTRGKKGLLHMIFSRTGVILLLLALQIGGLLLLFLKFRQFVPHYYAASIVLFIGMILHILTTDSDPEMKITWLVFIMLLPAAGTLLYLYIGADVGHRALRRRTDEIRLASRDLLPPSGEEERMAERFPEDAPLAAYLRRASGSPACSGCRTRYFPLGEDFLQALLQDLEQAEKFIFLEYFIVEDGQMWEPIEKVLAKKAAQGVEVRFLYDGTCEFSRVPRAFPGYLRSLGIQCRVFAPIRPFVSTHYNFRDHRKICVIDGSVAYTGGLNLADEYANYTSPFGHWKDTAVRVEGEAARAFSLMFLQTWQVEDRKLVFEPYLSAPCPAYADEPGYVIPYGDCPLDQWYVGERVYSHILNTAKHYVHIMTPYLILGQELEDALCFAAQRGVEVSILMPSVPDHVLAYALAKTHYRRLEENGVRLYEYTPGFVHAKSFVSDDVRASVGTINLDYRSLRHHFECAAYLCGTSCIADIEADFQATLAKCHRITREEACHIGFKWRLLGTLMKILAPLM